MKLLMDSNGLVKHWRILSRAQMYFKSSTPNTVSRIDYRQKMQRGSCVNEQAKDAVTLGQSDGGGVSK